ncbi:MAG: hypothetical protein Q8S73_31325 [Deltaproteobacteria bacterium]|nr:hypothetical protein [Myxococcales bacterium]MDP3218637.1 hypothetical protein [Deltaproteobacteria bacterium]
MEKRGGVVGVVVMGALAALLLAPVARDALAQPRPPGALPSSCSEGDLVVAGRGGRFECRPPDRALRLAGCDAGDFVVAGSGGDLRCERASRSSSGARNLLPDCSSGAMLVAEGFGRWRCVDDVLPRCSTGETIVSEGTGRWRCAPPVRR